MTPYAPKRVLVKKECHLAPRTKLYIENIKKFNPTVEIVYLNDNYKAPEHLDAKGKYEYEKETVIIGERVEDFIRSFPSPGDIVEHFVTVVNTSWMCAYKCEFCYLQNSQASQHILYTNFHKLDRELETAAFANTAILTVWSLLSFATKKTYLKIPDNLMETSDWLREHFVNARINSDEKAIRSILGKQKVFYKKLGVKDLGIKEEQFIVDRKRIEYLYKENKKYPLWLNTAEFQDSAAVEHLTGGLEYLIQKLPKNKDLYLKLRTRSDNFDVLTRYPLFNRVQAIVDVDPQSTIDKYEPGTASLDERIELLNKLQKVEGLILRILFEPIFYHLNWEIEFKEMIRKVFDKVDPKRINKVTIGFPRYRKQLKESIRIHYPNTTLFTPEQDLQEPETQLDARLRYSYERRMEMFNVIKTELDKYSIKSIAFNSETPRLWDMVGFDKMAPMNSSVFQYSEDPASENNGTQAIIKSDKKEKNESEEEHMNNSPEWNAAYAFIQNEEEEIDDLKFYSAESYLDTVLSFDEEAEKTGDKELKWTGISALRITEALNGSYTWKPIKLVGFLSQIGQPSPLEVGNEDVSLVHLNITDLDGNSIDCLRTPYQNIQSFINRVRTSRQMFSLLGAIVSVNTSKRKSRQVYRFYIKKISETISAEDMIIYRPLKLQALPVWDITKNSASKKTSQIYIYQSLILAKTIEREAANKGVTTNSIIHYIKGKLATEFKIKGLDDVSHQLGMAIEFAVLQSLSQHRDEYSYKLHSLLIGPPNVGKGFIPKIAKILNPIFDELPSNSPKLTSAGLVAKIIKGKSIPGVFPNTSGGTVAIEDYHEVRGNKRKELFSIFSKMMEDGDVLDKTSGNTVHEAVVSLHLDTNRYSQVYRDQKFNSFQDLSIPMNIFSRFDFIMEIPKDAERQKEVSLAMAGAMKLGNRSSQKSLPDWARELNMIIAFLRTHYDDVTISEDVGTYIKEKLIEVIKPYEEKKYFADNYEDMQNRVSFSVNKYVKAIACANMSKDVSRENVDYAFRFIQEKIKFIASIDPADAEESDTLNASDQNQRQKLLAREFYGKQFTAQDGLALVKEKMEGEVGEKTIKRDYEDINAILINKKKGIWSLEDEKSKKKL